MPVGAPKFSPYPYARLPRIARRDAAVVSAIARWIAVRPLGERARRFGAVRARVVGIASAHPDRDAALAEVRVDGLPIALAGSARAVRLIAQRMFGGPAELDAPRALSTVEHAVWALAIASVLADWDVAGEVFPLAETPRDAVGVELAVDLGGHTMTVVALCPRDVELRVPARQPHAWTIELPIIVARCGLPAAAVSGLGVRDIVVVERELAQVIGDHQMRHTAAPGAGEARVATGYVPRDMALPDDVHLELTVQLGTTALSLRQIGELAVGQVVALGRPLSGPYEIRAAGRLVGQGELVDVDGELGVRILALE